MGELLLPVPQSAWSGRSASWYDHIHRSTPSTEPGTDLYVPIGTPVYAPAAGVIWGSGTTIGPDTGRWVGINFDNGMSFRCMHHSQLVRTQGRVDAGELIAYSGASGYGEEDWSYDPSTGGAHTHVTLWPDWNHIYGYKEWPVPYTIDFMDYVGGFAGGETGEEMLDAEDKSWLEAWFGNIRSYLLVPGQSYGFPEATLNELRSPAITGKLDGIVARTDASNTSLGKISKQISDLDLTFSQADLDYLAAEVAKDVLAGLPEGSKLTKEEIAKAVRAEFSANPLK